MRWDVAKKASTFDWNLCAEPACLKQVSLFMEGLAGFENRAGRVELVPRLATHWQFLSPTQIVFKIRKQVLWSDGTTLQSEHFVNAWKRVLQNSRATPYVEALFAIQGAREFSRGEIPFAQVGIRNPDPWTIFIRLSHVPAGFPALFAHPVTWPMRHADRQKEAFPVVLGAFLPKNREPANETRFLPNPDYYRGRLRVRELTLTATPDDALRILRFHNGESDLADDLDSTHTQHLRRDPQLMARTEPNFVALVLNTRSPVFRSVRRRKRFLAAVDLNEMRTLFRQPGESALFSFPMLLTPEKFTNVLSPAGYARKISLNTGRLYDGKEIGENLRVQWEQKLNVRVTTENRPKADMQLLELEVDPYRVAWSLKTLRQQVAAASGSASLAFEGDASIDAAVSWFQEFARSPKAADFMPLFARTQFAFVASHYKGIKPTVGNSWDLSALLVP
ncbi:MAG: ABC transporter substrate-binding protein [Bdellovibrionota bacterium]